MSERMDVRAAEAIYRRTVGQAADRAAETAAIRQRMTGGQQRSPLALFWLRLRRLFG